MENERKKKFQDYAPPEQKPSPYRRKVKEVEGLDVLKISRR